MYVALRTASGVYAINHLRKAKNIDEVKSMTRNGLKTFAKDQIDYKFEAQILKKSDGSKRSRMNNPKLTDANKAGTREGHKCTLILTEGDSAKGLAMAGRSVVGPDLWGVFPLRGKLLTQRVCTDASAAGSHRSVHAWAD